MPKPQWRRSYAPKPDSPARGLLLDERELTPVRSEPVGDAAPYMADAQRMIDALAYGGFSGKFANGFALAHQQVSKTPGRFFVVRGDIADKHFAGNRIFWNPEVVRMDGLVEVREACLSHPFRGTRKVERFARIRGKWTAADGKTYEADMNGLAAQIFQHEVDHCEGKSVWMDVLRS